MNIMKINWFKSKFLPKIRKKIANLSKKVDKKSVLNCFRARMFLFSVAVFVLPFLVSLDQVSKPSFPVSDERKPLETIWVVATAYSSEVAQTDDTPCIPADGYDLCAHYDEYGEGNTIATNFLPLGAQVKIPELYGEKVFIVHDRMNKRYGQGRIDIWMPSRAEAKAFGVKRLKIEYYGGSRWRIVSN
ncbi:MAG: hypothetical protein A2725_02515 [Candidatus Magasanikbacteria bacterium RIFCSPHIGHO2_01_FULL_33_34]|uniref:3D domain-containing protein n=1 Tax=Candidatus Magasanikbacteria bacterium RIFCSPHIGHO2_01_FULL_33_34 TaxID=1798671 RepID=A0A1F6LKK9_9BACT|nr:MAG: hypothetical protein A2725_02515 [Candidatus Magasanikbacteria bacterium RIFCSPHIGHO2_01_FULL_33_34]OGH65606.1 MAG: hypothetical protein A3B83_01885 [Candidatus Magasanikbacteria bacterium RIFCSPHIGHO2_02_FULL_33_17]OGH75815.1 MAG: hypothetical protein A3A89_02780 [Candidatus Magasanikbacteria bacterium RIFCSPLOWO2_01_FULL_33_34]OGH81329.1 MAG: hypothetical protein A3F93_02070 [Candidatus Magasanikbacteria bacterium RIFCSPLOWO2_12_FULL_34_7]